ncbi:DUF2071 domain-containing protein [Deinococcus cellulosilyticus]|uniref:Uncharacterized protein n=1 Tax=Deinococcus cellulosilyticus (strain DSM 18568 / NBRC 106333 / KACC 11606 / 5516J-15) TaxID=1223518 RepID=A0A511N0Z0_DEIC1|nr:DUF2071 domain-containing protein [Deinococcus cellulosilyticus]GEM46127.1 hypothetical protein DC3_17620 [Deinococcus cellulosilyticus NBRC 106333 = KACC 11606]
MDALPQPIKSLLNQTDHRPYPLPERPWLYHMVWEHLMFLHYRVDASFLRPCVPACLELDLHDGQAWVSVVGLQVKDVILHVFPYTRPWLRFLNLDFRTYVKRQGHPGIWFFSLDASTPLMATGGRGGFLLPYHKGNLRLEMQAFIWSAMAAQQNSILRAMQVPNSEASTGQFLNDG